MNRKVHMLTDKINRNLDKVFIILLLVISAWAFSLILDAGRADSLRYFGEPYHYGRLYLIYAAAGLLLFILIQVIPLRFDRQNPYILMAVAILLCFYVLYNGLSIDGAVRYVYIGFFPFQPAVLAVLLLNLGTTIFIYRSGISLDRRQLIFFIILTAVLLYEIFCEPNNILLFLIGIYFLASAWLLLRGNRYVKMLTILAGIGAGLLLLYILLYGLSVYYNNLSLREFLLSIPVAGSMSHGMDSILFLDSDGGSYQLIQAIGAFVKGGLIGSGPGSTTQAALLPGELSAYILAILGEEYGLLGVLVIGTAFLVFTYLGLQASMHTEDKLEAMICLNLTLMVSIQAFLAMLTATGLMFPSEIMLPFVNHRLPEILIEWFSAAYIFKVLRRKMPFRNLLSLPYRRILWVFSGILLLVIGKLLCHDLFVIM